MGCSNRVEELREALLHSLIDAMEQSSSPSILEYEDYNDKEEDWEEEEDENFSWDGFKIPEKCQRCGSDIILQLIKKDLDDCRLYCKTWNIMKENGCPDLNNITTDDGYLSINFCASCGQIQGKFPIEKPWLR